MQIVPKIDTAKLFEAFKIAPLEVAKEIRIANKIAARTIAEYAQKHHRFKSKSSRAEAAIDYTVSESGLQAEISIGNNPVYAKYLHTGTRPHQIKPKESGALYFVKNGKKFIVPKNPPKKSYYNKKMQAIVTKKSYVNHPGTQKDEFLYRALDVKEKQVLDLIEKGVDKALVKAGLK